MFLAVALHAASAAAEPSAADKETARALVIDGRTKLAAGDAQGALKAFQAAHAIMGVPTTGLDLAKAQAALGMLAEARATALEVTRIPAAPKEPAAFTAARPAAAKLAEELAGRIPELVISVKGLPAGVTASVSVDGVAIPPEAAGLPRKANPGDHEVEVSATGYMTQRRKVTLKEGESAPVEITLAAPAPAVAQVRAGDNGPGAPAGSPGDAANAGSSADEGGGKAVAAWAWGAGAAGLVAIGVGVVFAVDYASVRGTVADDCPGDVCDPAKYDAGGVDGLRGRWNRDLGLSVGLGALGLAGIGTAIYGIVTAPAEKPSDARKGMQRTVAVTPWLSPALAGAAVGGRF